MRILYAVFGYGRGHATRAASVLSALVDHEVMILAGGDALPALPGLVPRGHVRPIPTLRYAYHAGRRSLLRTISRNFSAVADLITEGPGFRAALDDVRAFAPDLAICDAEPWGHRIAARLGIPRISFDHYGVLVYCRPPGVGSSWLEHRCDAALYRALVGEPDRVLVSSFYAAEPVRPGVRVVAAMLRDEIRATAPSDGEHLLIYFNNGSHQFTPQVEAALHASGLPAIVYGTERTGSSARVQFKPPSNAGFVADLAACRAVISTAGNQLVGEAIHFGKPMLVIPEATVEQRVNAAAVERLGVGIAVRELTLEAILAILSGDRTHRPRPRDGRTEALAALDEMARELTGRRLFPQRSTQVAA